MARPREVRWSRYEKLIFAKFKKSRRVARPPAFLLGTQLTGEGNTQATRLIQGWETLIRAVVLRSSSRWWRMSVWAGASKYR
jgi:hypothetical protein